jgi:hypothetical protein
MRGYDVESCVQAISARSLRKKFIRERERGERGREGRETTLRHDEYEVWIHSLSQ